MTVQKVHMLYNSYKSLRDTINKGRRHMRCSAFILSKKRSMINRAVMNSSVNSLSGLLCDIIWHHEYIDVNSSNFVNYDYPMYFESYVKTYILTFVLNLAIDTTNKYIKCLKNDKCSSGDGEECVIIDEYHNSLDDFVS